MKDRITLGVLIIILLIFLIIFQKYTPVPSSIYLVLGFMAIYAMLLQMAQYHQKRKSKKTPPKFDETYKPFVSILIPAHNEEFVIEETVKNMLNIDYDLYEIIVIDDRSSDKTALVLDKLSKEHPDKFNYLVRSKDAFPGKSAVLNEAMEITRGDVICVFDADARVKADFLTNIVPFLSDPDTGAVQARKIISNKEHNFLTRCQNNEYTLDAHFQMGRDSIKGAVELRGNGQLIKKAALVDIGGWNNYTITDDLDLSTRLHLKGWDIRFCPRVKVYEEGVLNFIPLLRQRRRWVEGSIRRYLDYFEQVLLSRDISLRVSLDMLAYFSEFVLPVWLIAEYSIQGVKELKGVDTNILSSLAVIPFVCTFFVTGLAYGLRKYDGLSKFQSIKQAIETGVYMLVIWTPIVIFIVFKIIFMKRSMDWGKTAHGQAHQNEFFLEQQPIEEV